MAQTQTKPSGRAGKAQTTETGTAQPRSTSQDEPRNPKVLGVTTIKHCARCGEDHENAQILALQNGNGDGYLICEKTGQPVFVEITEDDGRPDPQVKGTTTVAQLRKMIKKRFGFADPALAVHQMLDQRRRLPKRSQEGPAPVPSHIVCHPKTADFFEFVTRELFDR